MVEKTLHIAPTPFFSNRGCHIRIRSAIESVAAENDKIKSILCTYHHGRDIAGMDIRRIMKVPGYTQTSAGYSPYKFVADIWLFLLVVKTVFQEKPDIIHGHLHEGALLGWAARVLFFWRRIPVLMDMQGGLTAELRAYGTFKENSIILKLFHWLEQVIYRLVDHIVCSSEQSRALLLTDFGIGSSKAESVLDIVPDAFFQPPDKRLARRELGLEPDRKIIIYTGSLLPAKGVHLVYEAIAELSRQRDDLYFILLGYPVAQAQHFVREHGLDATCLVPGEVDYDRLYIWLSAADIALEPKTEAAAEASGKLIHYMAVGLPVVCFDLPNNRSMLGPAGYLAASISGTSLAEAIEVALDDPDGAERNGLSGKAMAKKHFMKKNMGRKLIRIYERMTVNPKR